MKLLEPRLLAEPNLLLWRLEPLQSLTSRTHDISRRAGSAAHPHNIPSAANARMTNRGIASWRFECGSSATSQAPTNWSFNTKRLEATASMVSE